MTVTRYEMEKEYSLDINILPVPEEDGSFVKFEDCAALLKERDALAAENAGLKECCDAYDADGLAQYGDQWEVTPFETPATDAAIANIEARGVENFGEDLLADLRSDCWDEHDIKYIEIAVNRRKAKLRKEAGNGN